MHIVLTVNAAWNIWNFRRSLVQALLDDGYSLTILAPIDDSAVKLQNMGCRVEDLEISRKGLNPVEEFRLALRMRAAFKRLRPDIVLSYTIKNNIFGSFASRGLDHAFIPNVTGLGTAFLSGKVMQTLVERLYRSAFRGLRTVFFQNLDDLLLFQRRGLIAPEQAKLLPGSGIDLSRFSLSEYPAQHGETRFLMIGRLLRDKGVMEYVAAARQVQKDCPSAKFQLLGALDTDNRTAIDRSMLDEWVQEGVIDYLGTTTDVRPLLSQAHCIILPSYREGAPRTLIEAAAMGRPSIATDVPGCRSVVDNGATGLLCEVRSVPSLAEAMRQFLTMPENEAALWGVRAREKAVAEFSDQIVIDRYREQIAGISNGSETV